MRSLCRVSASVLINHDYPIHLLVYYPFRLPSEFSKDGVIKHALKNSALSHSAIRLGRYQTQSV